MAELNSLHFIDDAIVVEFNSPQIYEKSPTCPDRFLWRGDLYKVSEIMAEWSDFTRRGRSARNMQPGHAEVAASRGSLGVGRFYFRVKTEDERIFEIYYDRAPKDTLHRKGGWFIYRELSAG